MRISRGNHSIVELPRLLSKRQDRKSSKSQFYRPKPHPEGIRDVLQESKTVRPSPSMEVVDDVSTTLDGEDVVGGIGEAVAKVTEAFGGEKAGELLTADGHTLEVSSMLAEGCDGRRAVELMAGHRCSREVAVRGSGGSREVVYAVDETILDTSILCVEEGADVFLLRVSGASISTRPGLARRLRPLVRTNYTLTILIVVGARHSDDEGLGSLHARRLLARSVSFRFLGQFCLCTRRSVFVLARPRHFEVWNLVAFGNLFASELEESLLQGAGGTLFANDLSSLFKGDLDPSLSASPHNAEAHVLPIIISPLQELWARLAWLAWSAILV